MLTQPCFNYYCSTISLAVTFGHLFSARRVGEHALNMQRMQNCHTKQHAHIPSTMRINWSLYRHISTMQHA